MHSFIYDYSISSIMEVFYISYNQKHCRYGTTCSRYYMARSKLDRHTYSIVYLHKNNTFHPNSINNFYN